MGISEKMLKSLLPNARPFRGETLGKVITALSSALERVRIFANGIVLESLPSTATDTLAQWFGMLGLKYDPTQSLADRRRQAKQAYTAVGGQDKSYIEGVLQEAYPDLSLSEPNFTTENMVGVGMVGEMQTTDYASWIPAGAQDGSYPVEYYRVVGQVESTYDRNGAQAILDRVAPAHLSAVFDIEILNATETSEVGLALVGLAEVGKTKED